jgi:WD40 repeat protein/serine/threonine protein kinase/Tfp pilus assembly protein PilF
MSASRPCPKCGAALPEEGWEGLCPKCLVRVSLEGPAGEASGPYASPFPGSGDGSPSERKPPIGNPKSQIANPKVRYFGDYELLEEIARGGMGVVYKARQRSLSRLVAVKMILSGEHASEEFVQRFRAEAEAAANLGHPNIVAIYEVGMHEGQHYFSMEYVEGKNLAELSAECGSRNVAWCRRAARIVATVAEAIHFAHQHGILHRDLKPSNVLIDRFEQPRITDFGLAKRLSGDSDLTLTGQVLGSPNYMPPEQAEAKHRQATTASDIYSLGAILYHLLTSRPPFEAETVTATLQKLLHTEPVAPRLLNAKVPRDLETICLKCLEKDPRQRYASAQELADELERYLRDEPIRARPIGPADKAWRWCRRKPALATSIFLTLILLIIIVIGSPIAIFRINRSRDQAEQNARNEEQQRQRAESAVTRLEIQRAEHLFAGDSSSQALAYLARLLRQQPTNRVVGERLMSALSLRSFCLPAAAPLRHRNALNPSASAQMGALIRAANFSPDGQRVVTASKDGTARIWDSRTGLPLCGPLKHKSEMNWATFSPDGKRVVTASQDHTARIWDAQTGQPTSPPLEHGDAVLFADFSPGGRKAVTASGDKTVRLWDTDTGLPISHPITHDAGVYFASFSADERLVLTASEDAKAWVWYASNGVKIASFKHSLSRWLNSSVPFPQISPDGKWVVTLDRGSAVLWEVGTNMSPVAHLRHDFDVTAVQFSPDGELLATASFDNTVRLWDARTGKAIASPLRHENWAMCVRFSADGRRLVTSSADHSVRVWDVRTGRALTEPLRHESWVRFAQFSPDGQRVLTVADGDTAWLWDVRSDQPMTELFGHGEVRHAVFSPDGQRIATTSLAGNARMWNARTGRLLTEMQHSRGTVVDVQFSPDGQRLVTTGENIRVWEAATGKALTEPPFHGVHSRFSADGHRLVTALVENTAEVWNALDGQHIARLENGGRVQYAEFSPDSQRVVTASFDGTARIWDSQTSDMLFELKHDAEVTWAEFSPDGERVATASRDRTVRIWEARTGRMLTKPLPHAAELYDNHSVRFNGDGTRLATAAGNTAQIWDTRTGDPITAPLKHEGRVNSVRFSPDGQRLVTACYDGTARVWDTATGHPLSDPLRHSARVQYAEFSPDGGYIVTASTDQTARIWEVSLAPLPIPAWLPELAEAVAGQAIDARENSAIVPVEELFKLKQRLGTGEANDYYRRWARWFFADSATRSLTPSSPVTVAAYTRRREAENCYARGRAYSKSNQWTQAIAELTKAIELNSDWDTNLQTILFDARAHVYASTNQFHRAIEDLQEAIERASQDTNMLAHLHLDRAQHLLRVGEDGKALADFMKAIELKPDFEAAYNNLAWTYATGVTNFCSPETALQSALKAVALGKTNYNVLNTLGVVYFRVGHLTNAIATLEAGIKMDNAGGSAHDFFVLAMSWQRLGDPVKAQNYFSKATNWVAVQATLPPGWKEELEAFRAEAEEVLGKQGEK